MNSNTSSPKGPAQPPDPTAEPHDDLTALAADLDRLATRDRSGLSEAVRAERVQLLRQLADRLDGQWLGELAELDARGAAGADQGVQAASTASWLRNRLHLSHAAAASAVTTARALFRGPLTKTAQALCAGELSAQHAAALAHGTRELPDHIAAEAEPTLVEAARRMDPSGLRRLIDHLRSTLDPDTAGTQAERRHGRRGLWTATTWEGMVALQGLLDPEAGQTLLAALEPLARPASAEDERSGDQRRADAIVELARRNLEAGQLPQSGGVRPQLLVTVDLDSLQGRPGALGGELGGLGSLPPQACRRLACDAAVTRVVVTRHHGDGHHPGHDPNDNHGLAARLQAAMALLPPVLGGAPSQPLDVGRSSRVITPAQRAALAVRDGGCVVPRLRPAPGQVRGPSSGALARGWPDRPRQPRLVVPGPSSGDP